MQLCKGHYKSNMSNEADCPTKRLRQLSQNLTYAHERCFHLLLQPLPAILPPPAFPAGVSRASSPAGRMSTQRTWSLILKSDCTLTNGGQPRSCNRFEMAIGGTATWHPIVPGIALCKRMLNLTVPSDLKFCNMLQETMQTPYIVEHNAGGRCWRAEALKP